MTQVNLEVLSKLSKTDLLAMVEKMAKAQNSGLMVKRNSAGGLYIRHDTFKEFSSAKQKEYVAGINIPANTALALFGNPELCKEIFERIKSM